MRFLGLFLAFTVSCGQNHQFSRDQLRDYVIDTNNGLAINGPEVTAYYWPKQLVGNDGLSSIDSIDYFIVKNSAEKVTLSNSSAIGSAKLIIGKDTIFVVDAFEMPSYGTIKGTEVMYAFNSHLLKRNNYHQFSLVVNTISGPGIFEFDEQDISKLRDITTINLQ